MTETYRAPTQRCLTKTETIHTFEKWKSNLINYLSLDTNFAMFLEETASWQSASKNNNTRGLTDDPISVPEAQRNTAVQKVMILDAMLSQIAYYCPVISRNTITKRSTSLNSIWQLMYMHYGFKAPGRPHEHLERSCVNHPLQDTTCMLEQSHSYSATNIECSEYKDDTAHNNKEHILSRSVEVNKEEIISQPLSCELSVNHQTVCCIWSRSTSGAAIEYENDIPNKNEECLTSSAFEDNREQDRQFPYLEKSSGDHPNQQMSNEPCMVQNTNAIQISQMQGMHDQKVILVTRPDDTFKLYDEISSMNLTLPMQEVDASGSNEVDLHNGLPSDDKVLFTSIRDECNEAANPDYSAYNCTVDSAQATVSMKQSQGHPSQRKVDIMTNSSKSVPYHKPKTIFKRKPRYGAFSANSHRILNKSTCSKLYKNCTMQSFIGNYKMLIRRGRVHFISWSHPSKKLKSIRDVTSSLSIATISSDGLVIVKRQDPMNSIRQLILALQFTPQAFILKLCFQFNQSSHQLESVCYRPFHDLDAAVEHNVYDQQACAWSTS